MIRSELKYLIGGKVVLLKCRDFGGKTGSFRMGLVFQVVRPVATIPVSGGTGTGIDPGILTRS